MVSHHLPRYPSTPAREPTMLDWLTNTTVRTARRIVIGVTGGTVVLAGVAMLVLPGPGIVTIGLGLAMLSVEFAFAQRWLKVVRERTNEAADRAGIPTAVRRGVIIGGLLFGLVMMVLPGFISVVRTPDGWRLIRNEKFSYAHSWTTLDRLERAAEQGDGSATRLLESLKVGRTTPTPSEDPHP
ncbi:MAG: PGPGW domain-containing protein [Phycisphaeraceae bacterium]|nr:PGPGW domain-containing protein [Phycisphaeraceae bacterium]